MSALWTAEDMQAATLGRMSRTFDASGLSIDTRSIKSGDMFVALRGDNRDGHDFVRSALESGASGAMVAHTPAGIAATKPLLTVAHTQRALEDLARAGRARSNAKIVAVTGSAGKTTTKEILRLALGALGTTHCSASSYNNHWGVPLSLALLPREAAYGVFEIGMNHFGEIRALARLVRPHVALITTIAPAHLEFFGNCEAIADAKSEIFEALAPGGAALVPGDVAQTARLVSRAHQAGVSRIVTFGSAKGCDARLIDFDEIDGGAHLKADICGKPVEARIGAQGAHVASNAVGALAAVALLDGDVFNAAAALRKFSALKGRGARFDAAGIHVIDESYNANPASMQAALAMLRSAKGRRVAVLGDMLEMGPEAPRLHAELATAIDGAGVDLVFASGSLMKSLWDALPSKRRGAYAATSVALVAPIVEALREGDAVLIKGSNGSKMNVIVEALRARGG